ncbi:MAG: V-type ATP synthase subunit E family protein [Thaumarchaeota archaeon]|nr:V-type ATP synthase subunit E family protein [Nitrososphaerota archaeon]
MIAQSALDNVVGKVVEEAKQEILKILESGKMEGEDIIYQAQREAEVEAGKILSSKDRQVESLSRRIIGSAELEARNKSLRLVEDNINKVFENALGKLAKNKPKEYKEAMRKMAAEAVEAVGAKKVILSCNNEDKSLVKGIAKQVSKSIDVSVADKSIVCVGGVKAATADGSIRFDNTLEARLNRMKPTLRKQIAEHFSK